jgi:hypothetical protein
VDEAFAQISLLQEEMFSELSTTSAAKEALDAKFEEEKKLKEALESGLAEEKATREAEGARFAEELTQINAQVAELIGQVCVVQREPDVLNMGSLMCRSVVYGEPDV